MAVALARLIIIEGPGSHEEGGYKSADDDYNVWRAGLTQTILQIDENPQQNQHHVGGKHHSRDGHYIVAAAERMPILEPIVQLHRDQQQRRRQKELCHFNDIATSLWTYYAHK